MLAGRIIPARCPKCNKSNVPVMWVEYEGKKEMMCIDCLHKLNVQKQETNPES